MSRHPSVAAPPPIAERLRQAVDTGRAELPPLPQVVTRLQLLLRDEDRADARRVGELVRADPAIAASVLRLANSATFRGLRRVDSPEEAISRIGLRQVSSIVTAIGHKQHFQSNVPERAALLQALWDHAVVTAITAKRLTELGEGDRAEAFLAGLLHDVGKLIVLVGIDTLGATDVTPPVRDELMTLLHTDMGHRLLQAWRISDPVCRVALMHHEATPVTGELLLVRVQAANAISRKLGFHPHPAPDLDLYELEAIERIGMSELQLAALMVDVEDEFQELRGLV